MPDSSDDEGSDDGFNDGSKFSQTVKMLNMNRKDVVSTFNIYLSNILTSHCIYYKSIWYLSHIVKEKIRKVI